MAPPMPIATTHRPSMRSSDGRPTFSGPTGALRSQTIVVPPLHVQATSPLDATAKPSTGKGRLENHAPAGSSARTCQVCRPMAVTPTRTSPGGSRTMDVGRIIPMDTATCSVRMAAPETALRSRTSPTALKVATESPLPPRNATPHTPASASSTRQTTSHVAASHMTAPSAPVSALSASGATCAARMRPPWPRISQRASPVAASQTVAHVSAPHSSTRSLPGRASKPHALSSTGRRPPNVRNDLPEATSQTVHSPPSPRVTTSSPPRSDKLRTMGQACRSSRRGCPESVSQTIVAPSTPHVRSRSPKAEKLRPATGAEWPRSRRRAPRGPRSVTAPEPSEVARR
mmetsp:Transcript_33728/g.93982  ORF Transcript_33728/g.93982 Transcript_33728/m.93982 type:complete len:344 (+) Transcript_33728:101-1132(+)